MQTNFRALALDRETLLVAGTAVAITIYIAFTLWFLRASVGNPFEVPIFRHLILFQDFYALLPFIAVLALALIAPVRALGTQVAAWCGRHVWAVAALTTAALAIGTRIVYHNHPLSMDEYSLLFQSRIFAEGRLTGQFPPPLLEWLAPPWLFIRMSAETGAVVSSYWPAGSLLLAPFTSLGVPWLMNPLIGGATILAMHRLALALFGAAESAGYVVLLTLASPAVTINAISYYSMPAHLLASALFVLLVLQPTPPRALLAGLVGSVALALHNPVPHLLFVAPWILWLALRSDRIRTLGALFAGYLPLCLLLGWGWPYFLDAVTQGSAAVAASPAGAGQMLLNRVQSIAWRSRISLDAQLLGLCKLWIWAVPGLVAVAALGAWRLRGRQSYWLAMIGSVLLTYLAYFLVRFDQGHGWGYRYFHAAWLALPLLAAGATENREGDAPLRGYLAGCAVLGCAILTTLSALQVEHFIARHLSQLPAAAGGGARVIIIDKTTGYYPWDLAQNDPFLRNPVLRLISRNPQLDREMMATQFPQYELLASDRRGSVWGIPPR